MFFDPVKWGDGVKEVETVYNKENDLVLCTQIANISEPSLVLTCLGKGQGAFISELPQIAPWSG